MEVEFSRESRAIAWDALARRIERSHCSGNGNETAEDLTDLTPVEMDVVDAVDVGVTDVTG